jgi:hypothetical protein
MPDTIYPTDMDDKDLYSGLIRLHVLHHACQEPIFGVGIILADRMGEMAIPDHPANVQIFHPDRVKASDQRGQRNDP